MINAALSPNFVVPFFWGLKSHFWDVCFSWSFPILRYNPCEVQFHSPSMDGIQLKIRIDRGYITSFRILDMEDF